MVMTDEQKRDFILGQANYQIPLAATKVNLWPTVIPYSMDSSIGKIRVFKSVLINTIIFFLVCTEQTNTGGI